MALFPTSAISRIRQRGLGSHDLPISLSGDPDVTEAWLINKTDPADTLGNVYILKGNWRSI